jgi:hypothetical protein
MKGVCGYALALFRLSSAINHSQITTDIFVLTFHRSQLVRNMDSQLVETMMDLILTGLAADSTAASRPF